MLTFNNLIYRLINHSNKNVKLLTNEFINNKEFNLDIIDLNPDTSLLSIICHCFIYKEYDISYKFQNFKSIIDNNFYNKEQKERFIQLFQKTQKIYKQFCRLAYLWKLKKAKCNITHDLYMTPITSDKYYVLSILQHGVKYLFSKNDLINIINNSLAHSPYIYAEPLSIRNPYNNLPFEKSILYNIYFFMKTNFFTLPPIFHEYFMCNFHLKVFRDNNECLIRNIYIEKRLNNNNNILVKNINNMIKSYNENKFNNMKISIDTNFPSDILIKAMKPYLKLYYTKNYSLEITEKNKCTNDLNYYLYQFKQKHPSFGRKILKFTNKDNKNNKTVVTFNTEYTHLVLKSYYQNYSNCHKEIIEDTEDKTDIPHFMNRPIHTILFENSMYNMDEDEVEDTVIDSDSETIFNSNDADDNTVSMSIDSDDADDDDTVSMSIDSSFNSISHISILDNNSVHIGF